MWSTLMSILAVRSQFRLCPVRYSPELHRAFLHNRTPSPACLGRCFLPQEIPEPLWNWNWNQNELFPQRPWLESWFMKESERAFLSTGNKCFWNRTLNRKGERWWDRGGEGRRRGRVVVGTHQDIKLIYFCVKPSHGQVQTTEVRVQMISVTKNEVINEFLNHTRGGWKLSRDKIHRGNGFALDSPFLSVRMWLLTVYYNVKCACKADAFNNLDRKLQHTDSSALELFLYLSTRGALSRWNLRKVENGRLRSSRKQLHLPLGGQTRICPHRWRCQLPDLGLPLSC